MYYSPRVQRFLITCPRKCTLVIAPPTQIKGVTHTVVDNLSACIIPLEWYMLWLHVASSKPIWLHFLIHVGHTALMVSLNDFQLEVSYICASSVYDCPKAWSIVYFQFSGQIGVDIHLLSVQAHCVTFRQSWVSSSICAQSTCACLLKN